MCVGLRESPVFMPLAGTSAIAFVVLVIPTTVFIINSWESGENILAGKSLVWNPICRIPDIDPWHPSMLHFIEPLKNPTCSSLPPLTVLRPKGQLEVLNEHARLYTPGGQLECCYQDINRDKNDWEDKHRLSKCKPFSRQVNLTAEQQFVKVTCRRKGGGDTDSLYSKVHTQVRITPSVSWKTQSVAKKKNTKMNVLILGIDSVSRLNFHRQFPNTMNFLKEAEWVELKGYNKVADNTLPNVSALLGGLDLERLNQNCHFNRSHFDKCPFIWKNFSEAGYVTAYAEDSADVTAFQYHDLTLGFREAPTDFYLRPAVTAAETDGGCFGPDLKTDFMYSYAEDFVRVFNTSLYFAIFWMNMYTHGDFNVPPLVDDRALTFLKLLSEDGLLDNTFMVFLSDHGLRAGDEVQTTSGWYESRLPFAFVYVPKWYRALHPDKYANVVQNGGKLTSTFDLYLTLLEILTEAEHASGTASCPKCVSLLNEVPWNRSCSEAGIPPQFCTCLNLTKEELVNNATLADEIAEFVVGEINSLLKSSKDSVDNRTSCAELTLSGVLSLRLADLHTFIVVFETSPMAAVFEATITSVDYAHKGQSALRLVGMANRVNKYGNQSHCVRSRVLRQYCVCVDQL